MWLDISPILLTKLGLKLQIVLIRLLCWLGLLLLNFSFGRFANLCTIPSLIYGQISPLFWPKN